MLNNGISLKKNSLGVCFFNHSGTYLHTDHSEHVTDILLRRSDVPLSE